jgi:hypothetical protein
LTKVERPHYVCKLVPGAGIEPAHPQGVRDFKSLN